MAERTILISVHYNITLNQIYLQAFIHKLIKSRGGDFGEGTYNIWNTFPNFVVWINTPFLSWEKKVE
jgi:hypothetical protein